MKSYLSGGTIMQNRRPSDILHFLAVVLLAVGFLPGCSQSSPPDRERIDSSETPIQQEVVKSSKSDTPLEIVTVTATDPDAGSDADADADAQQDTPIEIPINEPLVEQNDEENKAVEKEQPKLKKEPISPNNATVPASIATKETPPANKGEGDNKLSFKGLYASISSRGVTISDKVKSLSGQEVEMSGYMAPPLTADVTFFVLSKIPLAVCPFCSADADWPTDIVVVYMPEGEAFIPTEHPIKVTGILETGSHEDEATGFVSLVRIYADQVEVIK